ncbi:MAG: MFS transporter [Candidatus Aenigmarchaeota archaeon]|nr:MFS transporter [Candidatus Aenigmarchaeota archaeon]
MKTEKQMLEGNIWKFYIYSAVGSLIFLFVPILVIFFQAKGLTITQVMSLQALFALMVVILEVPTGAVADILGRKKTITLGTIFVGLGVACYAFAESFLGFVFAEMLFAIGAALASGADTAILYDTLKKLKKEKLFTKIVGRTTAIGFVALAVASIIGSQLYTIDIHLPMLAAIIPAIIAGVVVYSMHEPTKYNSKITIENTVNTMKKSLRFVATHKQVKWLVLYASAFLAFDKAMFWLFQPFFVSVGLGVTSIGWVFAVMSLIVAAGSLGAHKIEDAIGEKASLILMPAVTVIAFLFLSFENLYWGVIAVILGQFAWGYSTPVMGEYVNRHVSSKNRATVLSVQSLAMNLAAAVTLPFVGYIVDVYSLSQAFMLSAFLLFSINIILYIVRKLS